MCLRCGCRRRLSYLHPNCHWEGFLNPRLWAHHLCLYFTQIALATGCSAYSSRLWCTKCSEGNHFGALRSFQHCINPLFPSALPRMRPMQIGLLKPYVVYDVSRGRESYRGRSVCNVAEARLAAALYWELRCELQSQGQGAAGDEAPEREKVRQIVMGRELQGHGQGAAGA